jgi:hypothetical protein
LKPAVVSSQWKAGTLMEPLWERPAAQALEGALAGISARYGSRTRRMVAMQLEYPQSR